KRAGDREHLLLAAREETGSPPAQIAKEREVPERDLLVQTLAAVGQPEVLRDREAEEDAAPFGNVGDPETGSSTRRDGREIGPVEEDAAAHRLDETGDRAQRRRL